MQGSVLPSKAVLTILVLLSRSSVLPLHHTHKCYALTLLFSPFSSKSFLGLIGVLGGDGLGLVLFHLIIVWSYVPYYRV